MSDVKLRELQRKASNGDDEARKALYHQKRRSGIVPTWEELSWWFKDLTYLAEGPSKSSSGRISLSMSSYNDFNVSVTLGTYDIADWPRHLEMGEFDSDEAARKAVADKLDEAQEAIKRYQECDGEPLICPECDDELGASTITGETVQRWGGYDPLFCRNCNYSFHDCETCGAVYSEESDAGDCCIGDESEECDCGGCNVCGGHCVTSCGSGEGLKCAAELDPVYRKLK